MMTFKLLSRLVLLAVLGGVSGVSVAEIIGKDDRRIITDPNEFSAVGFLRVKKDRNLKGVWLHPTNCTATVIANKAILFARHCIEGIIFNNEISNGEVDFFPAFRGDPNDENLDKWKGISIKKVLSYVGKSAKDESNTSNDFAVGLLVQSITDYTKEKDDRFPKITPIKIFSDATLRTGETLTLPAYSDFDEDPKFAVHENCHLLRSYTWEDEYRANESYTEDIGRPDETLKFSELVFDHACDTTEGSSGAPVLVKRNNTYYIIGVHIANNIGSKFSLPNTNFALGVYTIFHDLLPFKYKKNDWRKDFLRPQS